MTKIRNKRKLRIFDVINACIMILLGFSFVMPFWIIACSSLSDNGQLMSKGISLWFRGFSFEGYAFLFQMSDVFFKSIISSLIVSFSNAALSVALCTGAAYVLAKRILRKKSSQYLFYDSHVFRVEGMIPLYLVIRGIKIYDTVWALIFPCAVRISNVLLLRNYFYGIPTSLNEAGELDGANQFQILIKIIIPLAVPMMLTIGMIMFVDRWNNWLDTLLYFGSSNTKWWTIQYVLRQILTDMQSLYGSLGGGSIVDAPLISARNAAVVIAVLPLVCLSPVLHKYYIKGMTEGAVKG
ncbi:MAG: carbohydrate ABC transporter permease [Christensenellaceae bacterium]